MTRLRPVRGTDDVFPDAYAACGRVMAMAEARAGLYGYRRMDVPVLEATDLFARGIGEATDIVSKEMYTFTDRGGDSITLRPEFTAGICRAWLAAGATPGGPFRAFAAGPVFRHERPQRGRRRQFTQINLECLGSASPWADVELVDIACELLRELGIAGECVLRLNSLGDAETRASWREALVVWFRRHRDALSGDSRRRLEQNPMRILDSKDEGDRQLVEAAPLPGNHMTRAAGAFLEQVVAGLEALGIPFVHDPRLVRGLDYYCHTAFEFVTSGLGAQGTVIAGGRYDGLAESLGGPATPGVGWAGGVERLAMLAGPAPPPSRPVAVLPVSPESGASALLLARELRRAGLPAILLSEGSLQKRLRRAAGRLGAFCAVLLGESEHAAGAARLRNMDAGSENLVPLPAVPAQLKAMAAELPPRPDGGSREDNG